MFNFKAAVAGAALSAAGLTLATGTAAQAANSSNAVAWAYGKL